MRRRQAKQATLSGGVAKTYGERIEIIAVARLTPYPKNARTHSKKQIRQIADSIQRFGFTNPVLIDDANMILAGHGRVEAAKQLGMDAVPCLRLSSMSEAEKRAYILADNKLALNAGWDDDILAGELELILTDVGEIDIGITGFSIAMASRAGDVWQLGDHRLACGDARDDEIYRMLMAPGGRENERAQMVFTDPPYNVRIQGNVSSSNGHREFVMASGEMSQDAFAGFLASAFSQMAEWSADGSIHFICMDWRHVDEISAAGREIYSELKNLIVWVKDNAGMGSFYRSRHELIFAFKNGTAPHINAFGLGQNGRYRTNVWNYRGITSPTKDARQDLALHPTVKPVAMVADAIKDCSQRGGIVLDPFCGSGTILIAAQKTGRRARAIELDPRYCDTAIRRWQLFAQDDAIFMATGEAFDEVAARRRPAPEASTAGDPTLQSATGRELP